MTTKGEKQSNKKRWFCLVMAALVVVACGAMGYRIGLDNKTLEIHEYTIESERLPTAFDGYKIAQVSDLHNTEFGQENEKLLTQLKNTAADIIVLTGDLIDSRKTDVATALRFVEKASGLAPIYYVMGNHETRVSKEYEVLKTGMQDCGVTVLENQAVILEKEEAQIQIAGLKDPACVGKRNNALVKSYMREQLSQFSMAEKYTILLSHRPEFLDLYAETGADLVFSGHAHGGQFRLPKIGGLFAPHQGFLPKYDGGLYEKAQTKMLVSRGLGNSLFPLRVNNKPEIVVAVLCKK